MMTKLPTFTILQNLRSTKIQILTTFFIIFHTLSAHSFSDDVNGVNNDQFCSEGLKFTNISSLPSTFYADDAEFPNSPPRTHSVFSVLPINEIEKDLLVYCEGVIDNQSGLQQSTASGQRPSGFEGFQLVVLDLFKMNGRDSQFTSGDDVLLIIEDDGLTVSRGLILVVLTNVHIHFRLSYTPRYQSRDERYNILMVCEVNCEITNLSPLQTNLNNHLAPNSFSFLSPHSSTLKQIYKTFGVIDTYGVVSKSNRIQLTIPHQKQDKTYLQDCENKRPTKTTLSTPDTSLESNTFHGPPLIQSFLTQSKSIALSCLNVDSTANTFVISLAAPRRKHQSDSNSVIYLHVETKKQSNVSLVLHSKYPSTWYVSADVLSVGADLTLIFDGSSSSVVEIIRENRPAVNVKKLSGNDLKIPGDPRQLEDFIKDEIGGGGEKANAIVILNEDVNTLTVHIEDRVVVVRERGESTEAVMKSAETVSLNENRRASSLSPNSSSNSPIYSKSEMIDFIRQFSLKFCDQKLTQILIPNFIFIHSSSPTQSEYYSIHLDDQGCQAYNNGSHFILTTMSTTCGSVSDFTGHTPSFSNTINVKSNNADDTLLKVPFTCEIQPGLHLTSHLSSVDNFEKVWQPLVDSEMEKTGPRNGDYAVNTREDYESNNGEDESYDDQHYVDDESATALEMFELHVWRRQARNYGNPDLILTAREDSFNDLYVNDEIILTSLFGTRKSIGSAIETCWVSTSPNFKRTLQNTKESSNPWDMNHSQRYIPSSRMVVDKGCSVERKRSNGRDGQATSVSHGMSWGGYPMFTLTEELLEEMDSSTFWISCLVGMCGEVGGGFPNMPQCLNSQSRQLKCQYQSSGSGGTGSERGIHSATPPAGLQMVRRGPIFVKPSPTPSFAAAAAHPSKSKRYNHSRAAATAVHDPSPLTSSSGGSAIRNNNSVTSHKVLESRLVAASTSLMFIVGISCFAGGCILTIVVLFCILSLILGKNNKSSMMSKVGSCCGCFGRKHRGKGGSWSKPRNSIDKHNEEEDLNEYCENNKPDLIKHHINTSSTTLKFTPSVGYYDVVNDRNSNNKSSAEESVEPDHQRRYADISATTSDSSNHAQSDESRESCLVLLPHPSSQKKKYICNNNNTSLLSKNIALT